MRSLARLNTASAVQGMPNYGRYMLSCRHTYLDPLVLDDQLAVEAWHQGPSGHLHHVAHEPGEGTLPHERLQDETHINHGYVRAQST